MSGMGKESALPEVPAWRTEPSTGCSPWKFIIRGPPANLLLELTASQGPCAYRGAA